jgi:serine O-acetyltransferase
MNVPMPSPDDKTFANQSPSASNASGRSDPFYWQIREEANLVLENEPELAHLLHKTVLAPGVSSFDDAVAATVCHRLLLHDDNHCAMLTHSSDMHQSSDPSAYLFTPNSCRSLLREAFQSDVLELGHTMSAAVRDDVAAVVERDPAMDTYLEVVLFSKGFAALVCHRAAHRLWLRETGRKKFTALYLQSQASALFGVDLHPLAQIGSGLLLDHGTGIVVGETASVGDGCTILHGVTLGGTGKDHGDRHPKVGKHVLIGAGSSILGNVHVGDSAKIGAGSVVLRSIPPFATAVGAPAKVRSAGFRPCESGLLFEASSWLPSQLLLIDFLFLLPSQRLSGGLLKLIRHMMLT